MAQEWIRSQRFYASGSSIYREITFANGDRLDSWYASTQCETGVPPSARELDAAVECAAVFTSHYSAVVSKAVKP